MANRNFKRVQSLNNQTKIIVGRFSTTAGGVATKLAGLGFTVAGSGSGAYTVTLDDKYPTLLAATANALGSTAAVEVVSHDVPGTKEIVLDGGSDFDGEIHFAIYLNNSQVA